jgi:hypothetical protein
MTSTLLSAHLPGPDHTIFSIYHHCPTYHDFALEAHAASHLQSATTTQIPA